MICVATNAKTSYENIAKWRAEIQDVEPTKPIILILTKSDLEDFTDAANLTTIKNLRDKSKQEGFAGALKTSSKDWEDFNVHKAVSKALITGYRMKYEDDDESD